MHSCIFNQRSTRCSDGLHHLILFLPARPFLGLVGEADPAPVSLHLHYGVAGIYSLLFLFTRCISTPFIFACNALSAVSDMENLLRGLLLRVLLRLNFSIVIGGSSKIVGKYF